MTPTADRSAQAVLELVELLLTNHDLPRDTFSQRLTAEFRLCCIAFGDGNFAPGLMITTMSTLLAIDHDARLNRKASLTIRFQRLRTGALPTRFVTVIPSRIFGYRTSVICSATCTMHPSFLLPGAKGFAPAVVFLV